MLSDYKFPAEARLKSSKDFSKALNGKKIIKGDLFTILTTRYPSIEKISQKRARLGIIVGKKFANRATTRNSIKRVIREVFRKMHVQIPSTDYVVKLNQKIPHKSLSSLKKIVFFEISDLFKKTLK